MTESALIKKLQLKPGLRALFLNAPQGYVESLGLLPDGMAVVDGPPGALDFIQLFVRDSTELAALAATAQLSEAFGRNISILRMQAAELAHADSLRQPPFRGNCLNWVLGHLAGNRDVILQTLAAEPVMGAAAGRYERESDPITGDGPGVLPLEELLAILTRSQEALAAALARTTEADLAREIQRGQRTITLSERIFFLYFHETYHVGQTELLRQLTGVDDKVI